CLRGVYLRKQDSTGLKRYKAIGCVKVKRGIMPDLSRFNGDGRLKVATDTHILHLKIPASIPVGCPTCRVGKTHRKLIAAILDGLCACSGYRANSYQQRKHQPSND